MGKISRSMLAEYIASSDLPIDQLSSEVAALLITENQTQQLDSIMRDVMEIRAEKQGIVELTAISAHEIDDQSLEMIRENARQVYPDAKEVIVHKEIDETQIGGAKLKFANASLDLSIRSKLNKLKDAVA